MLALVHISESILLQICGSDEMCESFLIHKMMRNLEKKMHSRQKYLHREMSGKTQRKSLARKSHGQRCLAGYSPWGHKELDMTER